MRMILFFALMLSLLSTSAQYKNDNVLYQTLDPADLCTQLPKSGQYLLLDVRSKGEYADTSSFVGLNLGHLKNAVNINVRELGGRLNEIASYKDLPVYVYCSHSQRSRRASKMLADSGFTKVVNINGGLTAIRQLPPSDCARGMIETAVAYQVISAAQLCDKLTGNKKAFLLDVRTDSAYEHISTDAKANGMGYFSHTTHIPLAALATSLSNIPHDQDIVITDLYGDDASRAADILLKNNYRNVSVLLEGVDRYLSTDSKQVPCAAAIYQPVKGYQVLSTPDFSRLVAMNKDIVYLDVRSADEFNNRHKDAFRNMGRIKNAINVPVTELNSRASELERYKDMPIVIYSFGGNQDAYKMSAALAARGFKKLYLLNGGLFNIRWTAANMRGFDNLRDMVVDIPAANL